MSRTSRALAALALIGLGLSPRPAHADEAKNLNVLSWNKKWPRFRTSEYVITGVAGAASLSVFFLLKARKTPTWTHGILADDDLRDALRLRSPVARDNVRTLSNWTAVGTGLWAIAVDSIVPAVQGKSDLATQMLLMDAESFALSTLVTTSLFKTVGRARPSYADCQRDPNFDRCAVPVRPRIFRVATRMAHLRRPGSVARITCTWRSTEIPWQIRSLASG